MANPVEQFTAPGKYEYDLAMELLEIELNKPALGSNNLEVQSEKNYIPKEDLDYTSSKMREK